MGHQCVVCSGGVTCVGVLQGCVKVWDISQCVVCSGGVTCVGV